MATESRDSMGIEIDDRFARRGRSIDRVVFSLFIVALIAPWIDHLVREDAARGPFREHRNAAPRPAAVKSLADLRAFPLAYQSYWNDTFGLRDVLLHGNGVLKALLFGVAPGPDHVIGKDGWIYWRGRRILDVWRGVAPLSNDELEAWRLRLERRRDQCRALGARYLFVFCPEKPSIYPEHLPDRFDKVGPSRLDQLLEYLRGRTDVDVLDVRDALIAAKRGDQPGDAAYYELGTHWRSRGAALACAAIVEHLKAAFPRLTPLSLDVFSPTGEEGPGDTEARSLYLENEYPQKDHTLAPKVTRSEVTRLGGFPRVRSSRIPSQPDLPRAVVFHDSFGAYLERPMSEAFSQLTMVWNYIFDEDLVKREKPDVVIEMFAERTLVTLDPKDSAPRQDPTQAAFASASDVRFRLDAANTKELVPMYRATLRSAKDASGDDLVEFTGLGKPDSFVLPEFDLTAARLHLHIDITSPAATPFTVYYKQKGDENYAPDHKVAIDLTEGRNDRYLTLDVRDLVDRLVVCPGNARGKYLLHAVEIRAER